MINEAEIVPEIAARLKAAGDGADSAVLLDALGKVSAEDISTLVARADRHQQKNRPRRAEVRAFLAGVLAPDDAEVKRCAREIFGAEPADATVVKLLRLIRKPRDADRHRALATELRDESRFGAAAAVYRNLLRIDPKDTDSWRKLAAVLRDCDALDAALILARHLIGMQPESGRAHIQHGNILARLDRPQAAIRAYDIALEHEPDARAVRSAIARQYVKLHDYAAIQRYCRLALHDDPKDWRAADGLAEALAAGGNHAETLVWRRRIHEMRPASKTARRNLAAALLRREHWSEGRRHLQEVSANRDPGATPLWDGAPADGTIGVYHRRSDPAERTLMGMAAVRRLAAAGHIILCSLPVPLAAVMGERPPNLGIIEDDASGARNGGFGDAVGSFLPLADAILYAESHEPAFAPWLKSPNDAPSDRIQRVAFLSAESSPIKQVTVDDVRAHVVEYFDVRAAYSNARPGIAKALRALKGMDFLITDDALSALTAAAIGLPSVVIVPCDGDWWWADRGLASPWSEKQTVIRVSTGTGADDILASVRGAIETSGLAPAFQPPLRPETGSAVLTETVERLSGLFEPQSARILSIQKLTGGTRNKVFRLGAEGGDRVLRLGRFPSPRKHFYAKESANMRLAAEAGLAPRVDFTDTLDGSMLIEFVDGEIMRSKGIRMAENAVAIAGLYRRLHQLPGFRDRFDIFEKIDRNVRRLQRAEFKAFLEQETFNDLMIRTAGILKANGVPHYATHNDPLTRNFIRDGQRMLIIDWECSGLGDPHWEVAALSAQAGLDKDVWHEYVATYFGSDSHPGICRIPLFEAACRYFWWTDALLSGVKRPEGSSWKDKAGRWWNWFTDVVSDKGFEKAIVQAESYRWKLSHSPASRRYDETES